MKTEDKGKEEDDEEVSKAGESWVRNAIIQEEKARGGEREEKGWCRTPVGKGRNRYGPGQATLGRLLAGVRGKPVLRLAVLVTSSDKSTDIYQRLGSTALGD